MNLLLDDLTMEPHEQEADVTFYRKILRMCPGDFISSIEVELMGYWDETLRLRYYGVVQETQRIGDGLAVLEGSLIMLSDAEMREFENSDEMDDERQGCADADDHERDVERYHETTR